MAKIRGAVVIDEARCKGCNLCVVACPVGCLALTTGEVNQRGYAFCQQVNPDTCTGCTSCALVCPDGCIAVYRAKEEA
ncbi:MAG: 4Fe-4S binding protein [Alloprevotella sp.]|nr:4Fe-4S binding protein [Alloprevotella sp.]MBR1445854.1 4Fe-4S binding protein [Alloprevotella sp.]MBR6338677.1 4Fe-4S binding protein [Alloprevotella sp.]